MHCSPSLGSRTNKTRPNIRRKRNQKARGRRRRRGGEKREKYFRLFPRQPVTWMSYEVPWRGANASATQNTELFTGRVRQRGIQKNKEAESESSKKEIMIKRQSLALVCPELQQKTSLRFVLPCSESKHFNVSREVQREPVWKPHTSQTVCVLFKLCTVSYKCV